MICTEAKYTEEAKLIQNRLKKRVVNILLDFVQFFRVFLRFQLQEFVHNTN